MTVGELRAKLEGVPDDVEVRIDRDDGYAWPSWSAYEAWMSGKNFEYNVSVEEAPTPEDILPHFVEDFGDEEEAQEYFDDGCGELPPERILLIM